MSDKTTKGPVPPASSKKFNLSESLPLPPPPAVGSGAAAADDRDSQDQIPTKPRKQLELPAVDRQTRTMSIADFPAAEFIESIGRMTRVHDKLVYAMHVLIGVLIGLSLLIILGLCYAAYRSPEIKISHPKSQMQPR